jgi:hypothetical protein
VRRGEGAREGREARAEGRPVRGGRAGPAPSRRGAPRAGRPPRPSRPGTPPGLGTAARPLLPDPPPRHGQPHRERLVPHVAPGGAGGGGAARSANAAAGPGARPPPQRVGGAAAGAHVLVRAEVGHEAVEGIEREGPPLRGGCPVRPARAAAPEPTTAATTLAATTTPSRTRGGARGEPPLPLADASPRESVSGVRTGDEGAGAGAAGGAWTMRRVMSSWSSARCEISA